MPPIPHEQIADGRRFPWRDTPCLVLLDGETAPAVAYRLGDEVVVTTESTPPGFCAPRVLARNVPVYPRAEGS
jgi:hypothetical protein